MYVRLAFAVAAHLEPEILIVDEVLAVGDVAFQNKCMGKMSSVARESRTVLFVSHNMGAIKSLTKRSILLDQGSIAAEGGSEPVISAYLMKTLDDKKKALKAKDLEPFRRGEKREGPAKIVAIHVPGRGQDAEMLPEIALGSEFSIEVCLEVTHAVAAADLCIILFNADGERVTTLVASDRGTGLSLRPGERIVTVDVHGLYLTPGSYYAEIWLDPMIDGRSCDAIFEYPLLTVANKGLITHGLERPWGSVFCKAADWRVDDSKAAAPGALTL